jgi:hypothetical protein
MYEISSLLLAIFILMAVIIVLVLYDRQPNPVVGGITLNTVIALAATIFRTCLMIPVTDCICQITWSWLGRGYRPLNNVVRIDWASRGPLGSLLLLPKLSGRYGTVSKIPWFSPSPVSVNGSKTSALTV